MFSDKRDDMELGKRTLSADSDGLFWLNRTKCLTNFWHEGLEGPEAIAFGRQDQHGHIRIAQILLVG